MLTKQDFLDNGYRFYSNEAQIKLADYLLQKRVRNEEGKTKYFINVWAYDYTKWPQYKGMIKLDFSAECRFYDSEEKMYDFEVHAFDDVKLMEDKMEEVFVKMNFICDPHND